MKNALSARRCVPVSLGVVGLLAVSAVGAPAMAAAPAMRAAASRDRTRARGILRLRFRPHGRRLRLRRRARERPGHRRSRSGPTGPRHGRAPVIAFWLDLKTADGGALLAGHDDVTISYDSRPDAQNNVGWAVFAASANTPQTYGKERYVGVLDRADGLVVERYLNTAGRDTSGNLTAPAGAAWKHVDLVLSGETARLYVDRELVAANLTGEALSAILGRTAESSRSERATGAAESTSPASSTTSGSTTAPSLRPSWASRARPVDDRAALGIPSVVIGDLPAEVRGRAVTWSATGAGAGRVAPDGAVDTAGLEDSGVAVRLEAHVEGDADPFTWDVTLQRPGGEIAAYVKTVTTANGVKDDPLAYADDRRSDALYVAARAAGTTAWTPLNRGQAILSVRWDDAQSAKPWAQMGTPSLFRDADGHLGVVASQNDSTSRIYVWRSTDDRTFDDQQVIDLGGSIVSAPRIVTEPGVATGSCGPTSAAARGAPPPCRAWTRPRP